jgi:hypothetical protein
MPHNLPQPKRFFLSTMPPILGVPDSSGYGDKRGRNKRFGPGGGTRRLHQIEVIGFRERVLGKGAMHSTSATWNLLPNPSLWGRTRIDERVKDLAFARHDTTVIGSYRVVANDNYAEVALAA